MLRVMRKAPLPLLLALVALGACRHAPAPVRPTGPPESPESPVRPARLLPQESAPPMLLLRLKRTRSDDTEAGVRGARYRQEYLLLCGVGPSGAPSCTPPLLTGCQPAGAAGKAGRGGALRVSLPRD